MEIIFIIVICFFYFDLRSKFKKLQAQFDENFTNKTKKSLTGGNQVSYTEETSASSQDKLIEYIREELELGKNIEKIREKLLANGWENREINIALNKSLIQKDQNQDYTPRITDSPLEHFLSWIKKDWLIKLGAFFILIGFGWLTSYAFLNNWIGPMGRIILGMGAGILFLALGTWRMKNYIHQGSIFLVLGSTIVILTTFAGRAIYDFFTPASALGLMFLSTVFVGATSVKYNNRALSLASLILAGIAPLLTNAPETNHVGLFAYLLVVTAGAIWVVFLTGQRVLTLAALGLISMYSVPHFGNAAFFAAVDISELLIFAYAFATLFFLTNTAGILKLKDKDVLPDLIAAGGNGLFLLTWIMQAADKEWQSLIISFWMLVFTTGAFAIYKITKRKEPFYVYAGVAIAMLAAATSAELSGATLTIAYTVEGAIITALSYVILRDIKITKKVSLIMIVPAILGLISMSSAAWLEGVFHKDFFVILILGITMLGLGKFLMSQIKTQENPIQIGAGFLVLGSVYLYILLWLSLQAAFYEGPYFSNSTPVAIALAIYTMIGIACYLIGKNKDQKELRMYGGAMIWFVVLRLLLVDIDNMDIVGKIITFLITGTLLISTAFLSKKKAENLSSK